MAKNELLAQQNSRTGFSTVDRKREIRCLEDKYKCNFFQGILSGEIDEMECYAGAHPSIGYIKDTYGINVCAGLLIPTISFVSEYLGAKEKMTILQMEVTAKIIINNHPNYKISEVMRFFYDLISGKYRGKKMYGSVDPEVINRAINEDFEDNRIEQIKKIEALRREKLQALQEKNHKPISYEEHCRKHNKPYNKNVGTTPTEILTNKKKEYEQQTEFKKRSEDNL